MRDDNGEVIAIEGDRDIPLDTPELEAMHARLVAFNNSNVSHSWVQHWPGYDFLGQPVKNSQATQIEDDSIRYSRVFNGVGLGGRYFSRVTNVPRQHRPYITCDDEELVEVDIGAMHIKLEARAATDFVVRGARNEMVSHNSIRRTLRRLCNTAGVQVITPHELRHSTSELWIEMGASEEDIRRLLCQRKSDTTRRYLHRTSERLAQLARSVGMTASAPQPPPPPAPSPAAVGGSNVIPFRVPARRAQAQS